MNLDSLPGLLLAWLKTQGSALLQPGQTPSKSQELPFKPGEQYAGKVVDNLASGRSLVKVSDQLLDMALPKGVKVGDTVRLSYLNAAPRPTFLLDQSPVQATQSVRLSTASQQVNALIRFANGAVPMANTATGSTAVGTQSVATPSTPVQVPVSSTATPAVAPSGATQAAAAAGRAAVFSSAGPALAQRPLVVNTALLQPARVVPGVAPTVTATPGVTALPGAQLAAANVEGLRAAIAAGTVLSTRVIWDQPAQASRVLPQRLRQAMRESGLFYESHLAKWSRGESSLEALEREPQARLAKLDLPPANLPELKGLPEDTARIAGRQLMMLEGQPFVWQGQAWPGQPLEWLVEERQAQAGDDPDAPQWRTQLRLVLPRLGEIQAEISLAAKGLAVRVRAAEATSLEEVKAALPELMERLQTARLNPQAVTAEPVDGEET